jgi:hypothetical protein
MQRFALIGATFILGGQLWLSNMGMWNHPAYRLSLMITMFVWFGWIVCPSRAR